MDTDTAFRQALLAAARDQANRYVRIVEEFGEMTPLARERFERIVARIFVDAAAWTLGGILYRCAASLTEIDQIEPVVQVHRLLSDVLYQARARQETTPEGDRAGQDDQGTV